MPNVRIPLPSHHYDPERRGMMPDIVAIYYRHGTLLCSHHATAVHLEWGVHFRGPYAHENRNCLRTLTVVGEHVQCILSYEPSYCSRNIFICEDRQSDTCIGYMWTTFQHSHVDFFTLPWKLEVPQPVKGVRHWKCS